MNTKQEQKIRSAKIKGYAIKNRGRKENFFCLRGFGQSDFDAINDLIKIVREFQTKNKVVSFIGDQLELYDCTKLIIDFWERLIEPVFPSEKDNLRSIKITQELFN